MSGYWLRTAARMAILSFGVTVRGSGVGESGGSYTGVANLQVPLRTADRMLAIVELNVGQWRLRLWKGDKLITTHEAGTEATCRSKARKLIAAQLKALRPSYADEIKAITASHTARGWEVVT